jgi:hypothetical protein
LVGQTCGDCYRSYDTIAGLSFVTGSRPPSVIKLKTSNYMTPYSLPAVAADAVTSSLSVVLVRVEMFSKRDLTRPSS